MKHTPGPWKVYEDEIISGKGHSIAAIKLPYYKTSATHQYSATKTKQRDANARSIAQVPHMIMLVESLAKANPYGVGAGSIANWCREAREILRNIMEEPKK